MGNSNIKERRNITLMWSDHVKKGDPRTTPEDRNGRWHHLAPWDKKKRKTIAEMDGTVDTRAFRTTENSKTQIALRLTEYMLSGPSSTRSVA